MDSNHKVRIKRFLAKAVFLFAVLLFAKSASAQQVGYVVEISGDWVLNNNTRLTLSSPVPAAGVITTNSPSNTTYHIAIAGRQAEIIASRRCRNKGECSNPITLPTPSQPSVVRSIFDRIASMLGANPPRYVTPAGKGTDLREAVVKLDSGKVDLGEVFKLMEAGDYYLKFEPLSNAKLTVQQESIEPILFHWNSSQPNPLTVAGLSSGLFRLSIWEKRNTNYLDTGSDAWVLVVDADRFNKVKTSFLEVTKATSKWGNKVRPNTVRGFLRAELDFLSQ